MFEAQEIIRQNNDWITFVFLIILMDLVLIKVLFKDRFLHTNTLLLSKKYLLIYFNKEKNKPSFLFQILFSFGQVTVLSMLFYLANIYYQVKEELIYFKGFIFIFCGIGLYFFIRYLVGLLLAYLFSFKSDYIKIVYDKINYFNNLILWLLPFLIVSFYFNHYKDLVFKITFYLFILMLVIRYSLLLNNNKKLIFNNLFYFILYICALELSPLIIILKLTV